MDINLSMVYTTINADALKVGDKVIVADNMATLRERVKGNIGINELSNILPDNRVYRFEVKGDSCHFALAYLIERKNNCLNCRNKCYFDRALVSKADGCDNWEPETEQKPESAKYRPFKDTDELIQVWCDKGGKWQKRELTMPFIWVKSKSSGIKYQIYAFDVDSVKVKAIIISLKSLADGYVFLDDSPCGVKE